tara:strand:+ start:1567 stop:1761 length:195 start_codon:yes stop_codon:yes gene_type:complete
MEKAKSFVLLTALPPLGETIPDHIVKTGHNGKEDNRDKSGAQRFDETKKTENCKQYDNFGAEGK